MAVIYREAISHELFAEISGSVGYTVAATNVSGERQLSNTNSLINQNATVCLTTTTTPPPATWP